MKKIIMIFCLALSGCAHETVHEFCSDSDNVSHYKNYDQCYAERSNAVARRHNGLAHAFDGLANQKAPTQTNCQTSYYGGVANTNCNSN